MTIWFGLALTSCFFYPLLATLHNQAWVLQWTRQNTWELLLVFVCGTAIWTFLLQCVDRIKQSAWRVTALLAGVVVPLLSFSAHIARQLRYADQLIASQQWAMRYTTALVLLGILFALCVVLFIWHWARVVERVLWKALLILSPLSIIAALTIVQAWALDTSTIVVRSPTPSSRSEGHMLVFVFDELSYERLYDGGGSVRPEYPNLQRFAAMATNYHDARAPGKDTLYSIPGYLRGAPIEGKLAVVGPTLFEVGPKGMESPLVFGTESLLARARDLGYATALVGPYFNYCELLAESVDHCRSYSTYNYAGISSGLRSSFSILNPIATNIILWPRQPPLGWMKRPFYANWQRRGIAEVTAFVRETISAREPTFLVAHIYLPHLPFVFNREGYLRIANPFAQTEENYSRQLAYLDTWFGDILDTLDARNRYSASTIVVLSDHNFRAGSPAAEHDHVPLLVKDANQQARQDVRAPVRAEVVLFEVVGRLPTQ